MPPEDDSLESLLSEPEPPPPTPATTVAAAPGTPWAALQYRLRAFAQICAVQSRRRPIQAAAAGVIVALAVVGVVLIFSGTTSHPPLPPTPPSPVAAKPVTQVPTQQLTPPPSSSPVAAAPAPCAPSLLAPVSITIPAIGVHSCLLQLGLNADRTVQTPTLKQVSQAGWYRYSAVPGAIGPTVILGHIDSAQYGPGVFFKLGTLKAGDSVTVTRADHLIATFAITRVAEYPKTNFPTQQIYGPTTDSSLRLITCGGRFDAKAGSYLDNIVAYGTLTSLSHG